MKAVKSMRTPQVWNLIPCCIWPIAGRNWCTEVISKQAEWWRQFPRNVYHGPWWTWTHWSQWRKILDLEEIYKMFNNSQCPALREKPKLFVVQACRGGVSLYISLFESLWPFFFFTLLVFTCLLINTPFFLYFLHFSSVKGRPKDLYTDGGRSSGAVSKKLLLTESDSMEVYAVPPGTCFHITE